MAGRGWLPAHRELFSPENKWAGEPVCKRFAWLDLCQMAAHKPFTRMVDGEQVILQRGEFMASYTFLAERWSWTTKAVRTFIRDLKTGTDLGTVRGTRKGTVYRIEKYDTYAVDGHSSGHSSGHPNGQAAGTVRAGIQTQNTESLPPLTTQAQDFPEHPPGLPIILQERAQAAELDLELVWVAFQGHYAEERWTPGRLRGMWEKWVSTELLKGQSSRQRNTTPKRGGSIYD